VKLRQNQLLLEQFTNSFYWNWYFATMSKSVF